MARRKKRRPYCVFLGAELIEVEDEMCPLFPTEGARGVVKSMVESDAYNGKYISPNQYESELNVAGALLHDRPGDLATN